MATKIIGRVVPQPQGEYDENTRYSKLDIVQKGAAIYLSRKNNNEGNDVTDEASWTLLYDLGAAIDEATKKDVDEISAPAQIKRLLAIDGNGQVVSIAPATLIKYIIENITDYDLVAVSKK